MNCDCCKQKSDHGSAPYVTNVEQMAGRNNNFRAAIWTGENLQMTLMCIPPCAEIGLEIHEDTDQIIRVERGNALVKIGQCRCSQDAQKRLCQGDAVFVPAGTWHNIINTGRCSLRVSSVYAPPKHQRGTVHQTKEEAEKEEESGKYL